jgi:hypothetical protein
MRTFGLVIWMAACSREAEPLPEGYLQERPQPLGPDLGTVPLPTRATDVGLSSGLQDTIYGGLKRGRACLAADFDGDGRTDIYFGNPGNASHWMRNVTEPGGSLRFVAGGVLSVDGLFWGGSAGDYDNDGDVDLFVSSGGNERDSVPDKLFRNEGSGAFVDATAVTGVMDGVMLRNQTGAGAAWVDYDSDGWLDLYVDVNLIRRDLPPGLPPEYRIGQNRLWRNNRDGTFTYASDEVGFTSRRPSRHSSWLDFDNDGDMDLYENNHEDRNILWRNTLRETGVARFVNVTDELSAPTGGGLSATNGTFSSATADFNQDGWEDLIVYSRGRMVGTDFPDGHILFLNMEGRYFLDAANLSGFNTWFDPLDSAGEGPYDCEPGDSDLDALRELGVMGSSIGDVNLDGLPDIYVGNGGPPAGQYDQLFLTSGLAELSVSGLGTLRVPRYLDGTDFIDFPAPQDPALPRFPSYPYRAHGACMVDLDADGLIELVVANGGPSFMPDSVEEPNQAFQFTFDEPMQYLAIKLRGDGVRVNRDAVGARVAVTLRRDSDGARWTVYDRVRSRNGFSAQHGPWLTVGLHNADVIEQVEVFWTDGRRTVHAASPNERLEISY